MKDRDFIKWLMINTLECRSDISDLCERQLRGREPDISMIEHRHITATLANGKRVNYDTLTTEISEEINENEWETCKNHQYE